MWQLALGQIANTAALGGQSFLPETEALVARFSTPPTYARKVTINTLIGSLISGGIWSRLDCFYVMAAADAQAARRNWITDAYNLIAINSPTFTADRGYTGNGSSSYLNTGYTPATNGVNTTQNSAHVAAWNRKVRAGEASQIVGAAGQVHGLATRWVNDLAYSLVSGTTSQLVSPGSDGFYVGNRSSGAAAELYRNGSPILSSSVSGGGLATVPVFILAQNNAGSPDRFSTDEAAAVSLGGSLNAAAQAAYDAAVRAYMIAVGAA